jgi:hypothetical protein
MNPPGSVSVSGQEPDPTAKLIPSSDVLLSADNPKESVTNRDLDDFAHQQVSFVEAAARLETIVGNPEAIRTAGRRIVPMITFRKKAARWSPEEDERLIAAIQAHGTDNWPLVAAAVGGGRSRSQCSQRWIRGLDPRINKANWSREEEQALLNAVEIHGTKAWTRIAADLGDRCDVQCRFRYSFLCKKAQETGTAVQPISPPKGGMPSAGEALLAPLESRADEN